MSDATSHAIERRTRLFTAGDARAGGIAGFVAGIAMGLVALVIGTGYGAEMDFWTPLKHVAAVVYGDAANQPGFDLGPVVVAALIHSGMAILLGVLFAVLYRRVLQLPFQLGLPFLMGGVYGIAIAGAADLALPVLNQQMAGAEKPAFVLAHFVYGVVLGLAYMQLHPKLPRRSVPAEAAPAT
jgi:hypothetical protein